MFEKNTGLINDYGVNNSITNFYYAKVVDINDPSGTKRIKARIKGVDDKTPDSNIPWAISFLPLNICMTPKEGEMVKIFYQNKEDILNKREWIGPILSSYSNIEYESYNNALNNTQLSNRELPKKTNSSIYQTDTFSIYGRDNSDILFKPNEIMFRSGTKSIEDNNLLNEKNMATMRLKLSSDGSMSDTTIFSDKIILSTNEGKFRFNKLITDKEVLNIIENSYSATYAEPLIEFLSYIQDFVVNHIHSTNLPPNSGTGSVRNISDFDLEKLKAKNIKIN